MQNKYLPGLSCQLGQGQTAGGCLRKKKEEFGEEEHPKQSRPTFLEPYEANSYNLPGITGVCTLV